MDKMEAKASEINQYKRKIDDFLRDNSETELPFPPTLTNDQRKILHQYAKECGLQSESAATDNSRFITIFKNVNATNSFIGMNTKLTLSLESITTIQALLAECPITDDEKCANILTTNYKEPQTRLPFKFTIGPELIPPMTKASKRIKSARKNLSIFEHRSTILNAINNSSVVVISGETGSGKTTQVPQYIMEQFTEQRKVCRIICTQPRRIAATSIANRVSYERGDRIGNSVGYQIRMDSRVCADTNLIFTTSGYLLRCLMGSKSGELFESVTHLILDEVHEREKITDFLLIAIKEGLSIYPNIKIVLMSATIDSEIFSKYFNDCPVINVPGRMYDVNIMYLGEILTMTNYSTKNMHDYMLRNKGMLKRNQSAIDMKKHLRQKSINTKSSSKITIPKEDIEFFDECLQQCLSSNSDEEFEQIYYLINDENMPTDYLHSKLSRSALTIAAEKGFLDVITKLIDYGANPTHLGDDGISALNYAKQNNHSDSIQLLQQYENDSLKTDYEIAMEQLHLSAYQLTLSHAVHDVDHDLLLTLIKYIHSTQPTEGSILVFLPGYDDIIRQKRIIESFLQARNYRLFLLHSCVNGTRNFDERNVFQRSPPGQRKIILATNIAETSLTIDDVVHVIDLGKVKQQTYESTSDTTCLTSTWISKACAKQRAGRAGRTQNGQCYRMYSLKHYENLEKYTLPEMLRVPLIEICLNAKMLADQMSIEEFLLKALQPPPKQSIRQSIDLLKKIDALDSNENITYLGVHLADLPVDAQLGKCIIYAILFKCLDPIVTIVSALSVRDVFILPMDDDTLQIATIKKLFADDTLSDHMMLLKIFNDWFEKRQTFNEKEFSYENMISNSNMEMINATRKLILNHLKLVRILNENSERNSNQLNLNSMNWSIIRACLTAGFYPNVCHIDAKTGNIYSKTVKKLIPHLSSVLCDKKRTNHIDRNIITSKTEWLVHGEKSRIPCGLLLRNISAVPSINIALFSGPINLPESNCYILQDDVNEVPVNRRNKNIEELDAAHQSQEAMFIVDDWISFSMSKNEADMIYYLRQKINAILVKFLNDPSSFQMTNRDILTLSAAEKVLVSEDHLKKLIETPCEADKNIVNEIQPNNNDDVKDKSNQFYHLNLPTKHKRKVSSHGLPVLLSQNQIFNKYFMVTIPSVNDLFAAVYGKRWLFNISQDYLRYIEQRFPNAVIILFFYVQDKSFLYGAGKYKSIGQNSSYHIDCKMAINGESLKPMNFLHVQSDHEMDAESGYNLLEYCKRFC